MFIQDQLYVTSDPALRVLGSTSALAHWRAEHRGPAYVKLGKRVLYRGCDLNSWLEEQVVKPTER